MSKEPAYLKPEQTFRVKEVLTGEWHGATLRIVFEAADENATLIGLELSWIGVRSLNELMGDLLMALPIEAIAREQIANVKSADPEQLSEKD